MKKNLIITLLCAAMPWCVAAQVEKQVEVTKAYVPSVESASKLAVAPDMTDTTRIYPDIDYTITPLSLRSTLATRPIRPATVTYWEFNRPRPFYLKVGAGYPLNSVVDFYASSQNPSTGYVVGYVNHEGRYAKIANELQVKNNSTQMLNRIGAAAGKYFGRHTLEGDLSYENRQYHRYGAYLAPEAESIYRPGASVGYGDARVDIRLGDDFRDLSRVNFDVALHGGLFMGNPELYEIATSEAESGARDREEKTRQTALSADARIAKAFGRHRFSLAAGYSRWAGAKTISDYNQQQIHAALRYGIHGGVVRFEVGADYYHDAVKSAKENENYFIPFAQLSFNLGTAGLKPFFELDGGVYENSFRSLSRQNPYLANGRWLDKSSVDYNGRFGIAGTLWRERFTYRAYAGFSIRDNHPYWFLTNQTAEDMLIAAGQNFDVRQGRQTVTSINGEISYRPLSSLIFSLGLRGFLYNDDLNLANSAPSFEGDAGVRYAGRKVSFGVQVLLQSERKWSVYSASLESDEVAGGSFTAPFAADLRIDFEWKISGTVALFAEGRNLANRKLYTYAWYPEYGANFTLGAKLNF